MVSSSEFLIIKRYLFSKKKESFLKFISFFAFLGIALGVATLIIVMSVMNGFRVELFEKILKFNPHISVYSYTNENDLDLNAIKKFLEKEKFQIKNVKKIVNSQGLISDGKNTFGVVIIGIEKQDLANEDFVKNKNTLSDFKKGSAIVGSAIANRLNLNSKEKINILSPTTTTTPFGNIPKSFNYNIVSSFQSGIHEFDANYIFLTFEDALEFAKNQKNKISINIQLKEPQSVTLIKNKLNSEFKNLFFSTWIENNKTFFDALIVERNVMFIILTLIILVAAFNIITGLTILVKNKTRDIAIFNSLGMLRGSIIKIFFIIGSIIGIVGTFFGVFLGVIFSYYIENIRQF
ncbi:MAG: FtsX-like permease family protein, partial [Pelagibacterales bacterium]|nr:FtsX-like permease family protein [Pelagibacterales bacterium]